MKILAIDTSTLVMGVSVVEDNKVLGEFITNNAKKHSVRLMPAIVQLFQDLDLTFEQIDLVAVSAGPGSYTGIRIGVATAKTLAWANQLPLYGISTLSVLAENARFFDGLVVPMLDARRDRVYTGVYQWDKDEFTIQLTPQVMPVVDLLDQLAIQQQPVLFLGDDVKQFKEKIYQVLQQQAIFGTPAENIPKPSQLGYLAWRKWIRKEEPETEDFTPDYLQLTQAEKNLKLQQKNGAQLHGNELDSS